MTPHDLDPGRGDLSTRLRRLGTADDASDGPLADVTAGLTARVRHRRRQRALGSAAAVASVVAVALVLVPGSPAALLDRSAPQPAATTGVGLDGLCGLALAPGYEAPDAAPLTLSVSGERTTVTADETWSADITHAVHPGDGATSSATALTWDDTELVLVATQGPDAGQVVGVGSVPLSRGGTAHRADSESGTRTRSSTAFVGCDGELVPAGQYRAVVVDLVDPARAAAKGLTGLKGVERTSQALPLTVRTPKTTPEGTTRPAWLDGTSLWCGMSETDLLRAMPDPADGPVSVSPSPVRAPDAPDLPAHPGIRIENVGPDDVTMTVGQHPVIAWIDASTRKVVSFGADELASTRELTVKSGKSLDYRTTGYDATDHCVASDTDATSPLPSGLYDLVVYTRIPEGAADGSAAFLHAAGPEVRVQHDGTVTTDVGDEADAALALTKHGYQPPWLDGTGLTCGMTESAYEGQSWPGAPVTISGFVRPGDGRAGGELSPANGSSAHVTTSRDAGVAWFTSTSDDEPGKLVSFGVDPGPDRTATVTKQGLVLDAPLEAPDSCAPDAHGAYPQHLPAGEYWIELYLRVTTSDGGHLWLTDSGAMGVTVDADGVVAQQVALH